MRALGLSRGGVISLFLVEALLLALAAMMLGGIGALIVLQGISRLSFDWIPGFEIFMERGHIAPFLPLQVALCNVLIICTVTLVSAWGPSRRAGRLDPVQALRTDG